MRLTIGRLLLLFLIIQTGACAHDARPPVSSEPPRNLRYPMLDEPQHFTCRVHLGWLREAFEECKNHATMAERPECFAYAGESYMKILLEDQRCQAEIGEIAAGRGEPINTGPYSEVECASLGLAEAARTGQECLEDEACLFDQGRALIRDRLNRPECAGPLASIFPERELDLMRRAVE